MQFFRGALVFHAHIKRKWRQLLYTLFYHLYPLFRFTSSQFAPNSPFSSPPTPSPTPQPEQAGAVLDCVSVSPGFALPSFSPIGRCRRTGTRGLYRYLLLLPHQSKSFVDSKKNSAAFGRISHLPGSPPPTTSNASPLYIFPPPTDLLSIFRPSRSNIRYRPLPIASAASRICTHRNRPSPLYGRPKLTYSYQSETLFVLASRPCWNP